MPTSKTLNTETVYHGAPSSDLPAPNHSNSFPIHHESFAACSVRTLLATHLSTSFDLPAEAAPLTIRDTDNSFNEPNLLAQRDYVKVWVDLFPNAWCGGEPKATIVAVGSNPCQAVDGGDEITSMPVRT